MAEKKSQNVGLAVAAYLIFFLPLLTESKNDPFIKFHVKQGLILFLFWIVISILGSIIPFLGWFIIAPIGGIISLVLLIVGIINALNSEEKELPLIGQFARNFKF